MIDSGTELSDDWLATPRQQCVWGGLMMVAWLGIGSIAISEQSSGSWHLIYPLICTIGLYCWGIYEIIDTGSWLNDLLNQAPEVLLIWLGISSVILFGLMWLLILLLPIFGNWRHHLVLLFVLQNLYAAVQALSPVILMEL